MVAVGSTPALTALGVTQWVALRPRTEDPGAPVLVGCTGAPCALLPAPTIEAAFELLRTYCQCVAGGADRANRDWATSRLRQVPVTATQASVEVFEEVCFALGVVVLARGITPSGQTRFALVRGPEAADAHRYRVDWRQPFHEKRGVAAEGLSRLGPQMGRPRRIVCVDNARQRDFVDRAELISALRAARSAAEAAIWTIPAASLARARAALARLQLLDTLAKRYHSDTPTQLRNASLTCRVGFTAAEALGADIAFSEEFISTAPWKQAAAIPSEQGLQSLTPGLMNSLRDGVYRVCGGRLRTCIDTGPELHVFYDSHARTRRELRDELLAVFRVAVDVVGTDKQTYVVSAFRTANLSGSAALLHGEALGSELATAWLDRDHAQKLAQGEDQAACWAGVALTRWIYDQDLLQKSLLFVDLPYAWGPTGE